jgi:hypothetical protein
MLLAPNAAQTLSAHINDIRHSGAWASNSRPVTLKSGRVVATGNN